MRPWHSAIRGYIDRNSSEDARGLLLSVRVLALLLGAIRAWSSRQASNPGGIAYLDIADAYMRGDLAHAVNATWSPLYSILLGPALQIVRPTADQEAPLVHFVNFLIYCAAMGAFQLLLSAAMNRAERQGQTLPRWAWIVFGYAAFMWSSLVWIGVADMGADLLMAVFVYAAGAILLRTQHRPVSWRMGAALGLVLGLGYLSKASMFPLSLVFLGVWLITLRPWRLHATAIAAALIVFALVTAPFVAALSRQKGRLTTGDVGKLVYAWFVNDVTMYAHWQGDAAGDGTPVHPDRRLHESPPVFEYAEPIGGTHPVFYDPSYWYEGLETRFDVRNQLQALSDAAQVYWRMILDSSVEWLALALLLTLGSGRHLVSQVLKQWFLLVPPLAAYGMFAVVHTESRFVGAFVVMTMVALLLAVRVPEGVESRKFAASVMIGVCVMVLLRVTISTVEDAAARRRPRHDYAVAMALQTMGVRSGDRIGMIGHAYHAYWARLAGLRFVAEVPQSEAVNFWSESSEVRQSVYAAFRQAGARWIVTESVPTTRAAEGWHPIGTTSLYVYSLPSASAGPAVDQLPR